MRAILSLLFVLALNFAFAKQIDAQVEQDKITINLAENFDIDLAGLVRWLSETKRIQIYTEQGIFDSGSKKLLFYGTEPDSDDGSAKLSFENTDELFHFVQAVLRSNGLAVVKSDVANMYRIVQLGNVRSFAERTEPGEGTSAGEYITAVFKLKHVKPTVAKQNIDTFVIPKADNQQFDAVVAIDSANVLVVTEMSSIVRRIQGLMEQIDVEQPSIVTEFYDVQNLEAGELEKQLKMILDETDSAAVESETPVQPTVSGRKKLKITSDSRTNRLILIGYRDEIQSVLELVRDDLDVPIKTEVRTHNFTHISAERIDQLMKQSLQALESDVLSRVYQSTIDEQANQLIVRARNEIHQQIEFLKSKLDKEIAADERKSPIRFYTLKNVKVTDILQTLQSVERQVRPGQVNTPNDRLQGINTRNGFSVPGANFPNNTLEGPEQVPPFFQGDPNERSVDGLLNSIPTQDRFGNSAVGDILRFADEYTRAENIIPGQAKITVDENTNTLIVVAEPATQQLYAELIEKLDRRRPQVLIEISVVTIRASDNFNLGIEVSGGDGTGARRLFAFSSFGLSEVDAATGALSLIPGIGFNGTLVDPETADVVLRALTRHERSRVIAAPRILVNDNATGLLSSVAEVPFSSINASNTVATTSFAGFAQAGTTISVTPHISEGNFLNLEFDILVNAFTGTASGGLPPARNTDQVTSEILIPDGHTVIVGGLNRLQKSETKTGIPFIENTVLDLVASRRTKEYENQRLFVFIKPIILQDDKFRDLRFLSEIERREACIPDQFPNSKPVLIE